MISTLPLSYCTNVHPGGTVAEVVRRLDEYTLPAQAEYGHPLAVGLWLAASVARELVSDSAVLRRFVDSLSARGLTCYSLNAFPYGDFHSARVKEAVYLPDWSQPTRLHYTCDTARILSALLPEGTAGSISTVPLGFKSLATSPGHRDRCLDALIYQAEYLRNLHQATGRCIRLAIEPEPLCLLETTSETLDFFDELWQVADGRGALEACRNYLGVCFDVCHQAVEFEDVAESIARLQAAGVRINKVHITCALELADPTDAEARRELARYVEPRYLHQTFTRLPDGGVLSQLDLSRELCEHPSDDWLAAPTWRVHYHVPVDAEAMGPLKTTRRELQTALRAIAHLDDAPHLEVETYTWPVLPNSNGVRSASSLIDGLARELTATRELLDACLLASPRMSGHAARTLAR